MLKRLISMVLTLSLISSISISAFASDVSFDSEISVDLSSLDPEESYSKTISFYTRDNMPATIKLEYTPAPQTRAGSTTEEAVVGVWRSWYWDPASSMSYRVDLEMVGSQWKMSNARDFQYSVVLCTFEDEKLEITRAISTDIFPCEVIGSVLVTVLDNPVVDPWQTTWSLRTTVSHDGICTVSWA